MACTLRKYDDLCKRSNFGKYHESFHRQITLHFSCLDVKMSRALKNQVYNRLRVRTMLLL
jgi:hypothetical protein